MLTVDVSSRKLLLDTILLVFENLTYFSLGLSKLNYRVLYKVESLIVNLPTYFFVAV